MNVLDKRESKKLTRYKDELQNVRLTTICLISVGVIVSSLVAPEL